MDYILEKLNSAIFFLSDTKEKLKEEELTDSEKKLLEADLVMHIERLIIIAQSLRGVKIDTEKARQIASMI